jgi:phosphomevalonate kinase
MRLGFNMVSAIAPGKAILCGEYAVLQGAPAVAVAVDRFARAKFGEGVGSPFVAYARAKVEELTGKRFPPLAVDSGGLYDNDKKLGLGSSAAVTVATVGLLWSAAGQARDPKRIFDIASQAHALAQGTPGSGIDVAVSTWGGTLVFEMGGNVREIDLPADLKLTFVWTGKSASTAELIEKTAPLADSPEMERLKVLSQKFSESLSDAAQLVKIVNDYGEAMGALGEKAGAEIVTPELKAIAEIARRHGGAGKPSGAGGGDLGVVFTIGEEETARVRTALGEVGLAVLPLSAPAPGLRVENA